MRRYRPWLAGLLALLIAGLGHAYLRRWRRAVGWFVTIVGSALLLSVVFAEQPPHTPAEMPFEVLGPVLFLFAASAFDAFQIGREQLQTGESGTAAEGTEGGELTCPHCGRDTDPELDFCTWCTEPIPPEEPADEASP